MAEIHDQLVLDIDQALRDVGRLEQTLDRALAPIEVRVDTSQARELETTLREVERVVGRVSGETAEMATAAGRAEVNFGDMARALDVSEDEARRLTSELLEAQAAANRLEDASRDVARQLGLSDSEANRLVSSLRTADRVAEDINVSAGALAGTFGGLRSSIQGVVGALAAVGVGAGIALAVRGANAAIQSFAQLEDSINAVNVVFKEGAGVVLAFGETAAQSAGLSELAFNNAVAPIGALLTNFGFNATQAADAAVILVQRGADLASVYGGSVQDALLAINSALVGQVEPLRRFGGEISQARVEAFALATGLLQAGQEMDNTVAVQARLGLILQDTAVVAGDYANTADDLANAQRTAAGEAVNFGADLGEDLAPAMEVIVGLLPDMLEGLRQLVPGLIAASDSAALFFQSIGEGGGTRTEFAGGAAILETLNPIEQGLGLATEALHTFSGAAQDIIGRDGQFTQSSAALARAGRLIEEQFTKSIGVNLARALDRGVDSTEAFVTAITTMARSSQSLDLFTDSFRGFATAANLTDEELQAVTQNLLANADSVGLNADEVQFLTLQLAFLNDALSENDTGAARAANRAREVGDAFTGVASTIGTVSGALVTAQQEGTAALFQLAADAETQAARANEAFDLFADAPEKISESFRSAVADLRQQVEDMAGFEANLARLAAEGLDALVAEFREQGPAAATQVRQALKDLDLAREANDLLSGVAGAAVGAFGEDFVQELVDRGITQIVAEGLAATFNSAEVIDAVTAAGEESVTAGAEAFVAGLDPALQASFADVDFSNVIADALRSNDILHAFADSGAAGAQAYVSGFRGPNGLRSQSPSLVFMDIAKDAADGFRLGWEQQDLTLKTPQPGITGTINPGTAGAAGGGGVHIELTTVNPIQQDQVSDVARMAQQASSIANSYRSVVPNGM